MTAPFLELREISKVYPGVVALDGVSLAIAPGEVVGLVGENGAGKSTLMKVLGGVVEPSSGSIRIDGEARAAMTVRGAMEAGIAFVHQELNLFENLDVAANVFIGREPLRNGALGLAERIGLIDRRRLTEDVRSLLARLEVEFGPESPVAKLSLAERQLVEIAKALSLDSRLVIMDEPTSSLTLAETDRLMNVIAGLKASGVSIIFISHRLGELSACADRIEVLRDGRMVGSLAEDEITYDNMTRLMIGRDLTSLYRAPAAAPGAPVLEIVALRTEAFPDNATSLEIRRGEILGLAGLIGSGRTELARAVFGIDPPVAGALRLDGVPIAIGTPGDAISKGLYLVPEDRKRSGLLLDLSIAGNVSLPQLGKLAKGGIVNRRGEAEVAERQRRELNIRSPDIETVVGSLSGGNQQKVVLGKWLSMQPRVILFDEPTRGIDVGAKSEIYEMLRALADAGVAILMISSDMEEVLGVSDRIAVMREGAISGLLERSDFSEQNILSLAVSPSLH